MSWSRRTLRREARRLARESEGGRAVAARPVARALRAATRPPDAQARHWAARIETERRRLADRGDPLSGGRGTTLTVGEVTRRASVPPRQAALLFSLVRHLEARRCLEMGTCVGISGAYLAGAMATQGGGRLVSLEGHADRAAVAREVWQRLGLDDAEVIDGRFDRTLSRALAQGPPDLVFVDGHHDGEATVDYVEQIRQACRPGALLILDDVDWSDDMRHAWALLQARLTASVTGDLGRLGLLRLGPADAGG